MMRLLCCIVLIIFSVSASAQLIVNIENSRMQSDTTGWMGSIGTSFSFTKSVQQILNVNANMHLQYKTEKDLYLILANYNLLKGNQQALSNNMFYHLRYNRKLNTILRGEVFTQWQQNNITNIDLRALVGTGPRFKVYQSSKFKLYAATLAMYEYERDKMPLVLHHDLRSDTYVSFTYKPNNFIEVTSTTFYQPLFKQLSDFRLLNQITFSVQAGKHFSVATSWDYLYDAFPAARVPKVNYTINNALNYTF
jgi:hypothetical protein